MSDRSSFKELVIDIGWAVSGTLFLTLAGFTLNVLLGNLFDAEGLGRYSMLVTIYLTMGTLASVGIPAALTKFTTEYADQPTVGMEFFSASLFFTMLCGLLGSVLLVLLREWAGAVFHMPDLSDMLLIVMIALPAFALNKIILARLRGLRQMRLFSICESGRYLLLIITTGGIVVWERTLNAAVWALVITELVLLAVLWLTVVQPRLLTWRNLRTRGRILSVFGGQIVFSRLFVDLDARIGLLLVGYYLSSTDVGVFTVAFMLSSGLTLLPAAFQKVTGPVITRTFISGQIHALEQFINRTMQVSAFVLTLISMPLVFLFPWIIRFLYPHQNVFLGAQTALNILVLGFLFRGITASVGSVFVSIGRPDFVMKTAPLRLLLNVLVSVTAINWCGINGIAAGTAITALMVFGLWLLYMPKLAGVKIDYRPLFNIPALGGFFLLLAYVLVLIMPGWAALSLSLCVFVFIALRLWHFEEYIFRFFQATAGQIKEVSAK